MQLERVNRVLYRRTRVATLFPNEASLLLLVSALTAEISEEWETTRAYITMRDDAQEPDSRPPDPTAPRRDTEPKHPNPE